MKNDAYARPSPQGRHNNKPQCSATELWDKINEQCAMNNEQLGLRTTSPQGRHNNRPQCSVNGIVGKRYGITINHNAVQRNCGQNGQNNNKKQIKILFINKFFR